MLKFNLLKVLRKKSLTMFEIDSLRSSTFILIKDILTLKKLIVYVYSYI